MEMWLSQGSRSSNAEGSQPELSGGVKYKSKNTAGEAVLKDTDIKERDCDEKECQTCGDTAKETSISWKVFSKLLCN